MGWCWKRQGNTQPLNTEVSVWTNLSCCAQGNWITIKSIERCLGLDITCTVCVGILAAKLALPISLEGCCQVARFWPSMLLKLCRAASSGWLWMQRPRCTRGWRSCLLKEWGKRVSSMSSPKALRGVYCIYPAFQWVRWRWNKKLIALQASASLHCVTCWQKELVDTFWTRCICIRLKHTVLQSKEWQDPRPLSLLQLALSVRKRPPTVLRLQMWSNLCAKYCSKTVHI